MTVVRGSSDRVLWKAGTPYVVVAGEGGVRKFRALSIKIKKVIKRSAFVAIS